MATTKPGKHPGGRPTSYTEAIAAEICRQVIEEDKSLRTICKAKNMPSTSMVMRWLQDNVEFRERYARAKSEAADTTFESIQEIEQKVLDGELDPNSARVIIDARKWRAGKMRPKKYGERIGVDHQVEGLESVLKSLDGGK